MSEQVQLTPKAIAALSSLGLSQLAEAETQRARIAELEASVREAEAERDEYKKKHESLTERHAEIVASVLSETGDDPGIRRTMCELESDLAAARVAIGELVGGLKVFAEYAAGFDQNSLTWVDAEPVRGKLSVLLSNGNWYPVLGDCRHAAAIVARYGQ